MGKEVIISERGNDFSRPTFVEKMQLSFALKNTFLFLVFIVIGTLSHEFGHYFIAKVLGYPAHIAYDRTFIGTNPGTSSIPLLYQYFGISFGGPLITMLIGTAGVLLCIKNRYYIQLNRKAHLYIILALFWGRELYCLIVTAFYFFLGNGPVRGDETYLSNLLDLPSGFFAVLLGSLAFLICVYLFFYIKRNLRLVFLISAIVGALAGTVLWFMWLGPLLLPHVVK
jgi:hypothetical protein